MRNLTTVAAVVLFAATMNAQQWNGNPNATDHIHRNGNVSIGTDQDIDNLTLNGDFRMFENNRILFGDFLGRTFGNHNSKFTITYPANFLQPTLSPTGLYFHPSYNTLPYLVGEIPNDKVLLFLSDNYKVGIGTQNLECTTCTGYKLFVKDGIKTEKVKVEIAASNGWADYVFKKDYLLMPLNELDQFIKTNGHLPEVPTTEEAIANGIELKEMNILLLKKVEELTLYTLQQQKQIDLQQEELQEQSKSLKKLAEKIKNQN